MKIKMAYGKTGLEVNLPDHWNVSVLEPRFVPGVADEPAALWQALKNPIGAPAVRDFVRPTDRVGIIFNDITRATPNQLIIPAILQQIPHVPVEQIVLFDALGTHRRNTDLELRQMLGDELVDGYRIVQNNAFDRSTQVYMGCSSHGNEIWLNRELVQCDVQILTGFIEPHFFAGFSGGGKAVMPGMAGLQTVMNNHTPQAVSHPMATWGETAGNPIFEEIQQVTSGHVSAEGVGRQPASEPQPQLHTFLLNVTLNKYQQITAVFAGDLVKAHHTGCDFVRSTAMVPVEQPFDIVVTSNSGYPLDQNLYQAVKGMSAAAQIVRQGGAIIAVSECSDGVPDHGEYAQLLRQSGSPQGWLEMVKQPGFQQHDQWQAQVQANICQRAAVHLYSDFLSDEQIRAAWLEPCRDVAETLGKLRQQVPGARIAFLPEGPQTVPYVVRRS